MRIDELIAQAKVIWEDALEAAFNISPQEAEFHCKPDRMNEFCNWLHHQKIYHFAGMIVEERSNRWDIHYLFYEEGVAVRILVKTGGPLDQKSFQSISRTIHAADWYEREAEDLFGLVFEGHPRLGDFILHDDVWQEGVEPMRAGFNIGAALENHKPKRDWRPRRIVRAPGSFIMPVGPVYSGDAESVHFHLETVGEEVIRVFPRLFFKYRGVEKIAEGQSVDEALLLAERFAGTTAFSHALAFCMAVEKIGPTVVPERAVALRVFFAELERCRHHIGVIESICNSTGLAVAASQAAILEEDALRLACELAGHRYLFGLVVPGGLSCDLDTDRCCQAVNKLKGIVQRLNDLDQALTASSSFLDRIEEVGIITESQARDYELVGPVARGSSYCNDLRRAQPYLLYDQYDFDIPCEQEGDGYARLRLLFAEVNQSLRIMDQVTENMPTGPVSNPYSVSPGAAVAGVETPRGATWHWVRVAEDGKIARYRPITPSFANWHGLHLAVESFAFQDFPIVLATFGLSVSENDR